jgi:hypothetical protein
MAKKGPAATPTPSLSAAAAACPLSHGRAGAPSRSAPTARALPADPRLVFPYDRNALYTVNAFFGLYTHLEFDEGEEIVGAYVNDETEFEMKVARTGHDVMIRPRNRGAVGGLTVITDRRRYEFDLLDISGCAEVGEAVQRYQRVSFTYLDGVYEASRGARGASSIAGAGFGPPACPLCPLCRACAQQLRHQALPQHLVWLPRPGNWAPARLRGQIGRCAWISSTPTTASRAPPRSPPCR